jgi:hypothetical protein
MSSENGNGESAPAVVTAVLDAWCVTCDKLRPATEFVDTIGGPKHESCRKCRGTEDGDKRALQVKDFAKHLVAEARGQHINSPHITEVSAGMFELFGGVEGFCKEWKEHIDIVLATRPGTKVVLDQFNDLMRLAKFATEHRSTAPDVATITDAELLEEMTRLIGAIAQPAELESEE